MMMGGTRKHAKARRRATKLINSAISKGEAGTSGTSNSGNGEGASCSNSDKGSPTAFPVTNCLESGSSIRIMASATSSSGWKCEARCWSTGRGYVSSETKQSSGGCDEQNVSRKGDCVVCGISSTSSCSACSKVFYCGKAHQKKHWNEGHKSVCYPCEEMSPEEQKEQVGPLGKGPFMKASKDLSPMEKIYEDTPLMTGPGCCAHFSYEPLCLGCTTPVESFQKCSTCRWPLCGPICEKESLHAEYECEIFAANCVMELGEPFQYELVRILRCLLTKNKAPEIFEHLMALDGALEQRKILDCLIEATTTVCMFIKDNCNIREFDDETINHMCGVVDLQTQPSGPHRSSMQIFAFPTKLLHACDANTRIIEVVRPNGQNLLQVVAVRPIKKGEPLTQRLLLNLEPTYERQKFLKEHYYFQCKCGLCMDPTEKGTYFSAIKCPVCAESGGPKGCPSHQRLRYVLSLSPTNLDSPWACNTCKSEFSAKMILEKLDTCEQDYWKFKDDLIGMTEEEMRVAIRKKISELEQEFHPNSFIVWKLKQLLFNKLTECIILMLPPSTWKKFREIYAEVEELACCIITTVHSLQPGFTLIRGRSLHDLVGCFWGYIQWAVMYGKATSFQNHRDATEFYKLVEETIIIFEPEVTDIKKVVDSVVFMRDHVQEIRLRMQQLGRIIQADKPLHNNDEERKN